RAFQASDDAGTLHPRTLALHFGTCTLARSTWCPSTLSDNRNRQISIRSRLVPSHIPRANSDDVVAWRERRRIPDARRRLALSERVRDDVEESRDAAAVERNAAAGRVHGASGVGRGAQAIEHDRLAR